MTRLNTCPNCGLYSWACLNSCQGKIMPQNPIPNANPSDVYNSRETELVTVGASNATSSKLDLDFHDLPWAGLAAAARRFAYGRSRHGRFNWKKGDADFAEERLKHAMNHAMLFAEYRKQEDLDAALCNFMMLAYYKYNGVLSNNPVKDYMYAGKVEKQSNEPHK